MAQRSDLLHTDAYKDVQAWSTLAELLHLLLLILPLLRAKTLLGTCFYGSLPLLFSVRNLVTGRCTCAAPSDSTATTARVFATCHLGAFSSRPSQTILNALIIDMSHPAVAAGCALDRDAHRLHPPPPSRDRLVNCCQGQAEKRGLKCQAATPAPSRPQACPPFPLALQPANPCKMGRRPNSRAKARCGFVRS